jgi:hypothetical protein
LFEFSSPFHLNAKQQSFAGNLRAPFLFGTVLSYRQQHPFSLET